MCTAYKCTQCIQDTSFAKEPYNLEYNVYIFVILHTGLLNTMCTYVHILYTCILNTMHTHVSGIHCKHLHTGHYTHMHVCSIYICILNTLSGSVYSSRWHMHICILYTYVTLHTPGIAASLAIVRTCILYEYICMLYTRFTLHTPGSAALSAMLYI